MRPFPTQALYCPATPPAYYSFRTGRGRTVVYHPNFYVRLCTFEFTAIALTKIRVQLFDGAAGYAVGIEAVDNDVTFPIERSSPLSMVSKCGSWGYALLGSITIPQDHNRRGVAFVAQLFLHFLAIEHIQVRCSFVVESRCVQ